MELPRSNAVSSSCADSRQLDDMYAYQHQDSVQEGQTMKQELEPDVSAEGSKIILHLDTSNDALLITKTQDNISDHGNACEEASEDRGSVKQIQSQEKMQLNEEQIAQEEKECFMNSGTEKPQEECEDYGPPGCECKKQCWKIFTFEEIRDIYDRFWAFDTDQEKRKWLQTHVVGRSDQEDYPPATQRGLYKKYQLMSRAQGCMVKVCSAFFKRSLGVSTVQFLYFLEGECKGQENPKVRPNRQGNAKDRRAGSKKKTANSKNTKMQGKSRSPYPTPLDIQIDNAEEDADDVDGVNEWPQQSESGSDHNCDTFEVDLDLGDQIAALYVEHAIVQHPWIVQEAHQQRIMARMLHCFNKTYPMHTMEMYHFTPIYQKVYTKFSRKTPRPCGDGADSTLDPCEWSDNEVDDVGETASECSVQSCENDAKVSQNTRDYRERGETTDVLGCDLGTITEERNPDDSVRRSTRSTRMTGIMNEKTMSRGEGIASRLRQAREESNHKSSKPDTLRGPRLLRVSLRRVSVDESEMRKGGRQALHSDTAVSGAENEHSNLQKAAGLHPMKRGRTSLGIRKRTDKLKQYAKIKSSKAKKKTGLLDESQNTLPERRSAPIHRMSEPRYKLKVLRFKHKHPLLPACKCTRRNCSGLIPEEQRHTIHDAFWSMVSVHDRKAWLLKHVERVEPAKDIISLFHQRKYVTKRYYMPDSSGTDVEICRTFFIHTLGFKSDSVLDHIIRSKLPVTVAQLRPRKRPIPKLPENVVESVKKYIQSVKDCDDSSALVTDYGTKLSSQCSVKSKAALKMKLLYADYREKYKSLKFNLGYVSFRRICESAISERQPGESGSKDGDEIPKGSDAIPNAMEDCGSSRIDQDEDMHESSQNSDALSCISHTNRTHVPFGFAVDHTANNLSSSSPSSTELNNGVDKGPCILDVDRGILKTFEANGFQIPKDPPPRQGGVKGKDNSVSKRDDGPNHPVLPGCTNCQKKCPERFSELRRHEINGIYWSMPGYTKRKHWLLDHLRQEDCKPCKVVSSDSGFRKSESRIYFLPDLDGNKHQVCCRFFLSTLGYKWDKPVDIMMRTTGREDMVAASDMRGKSEPIHKIKEEAVISIIKYIEAACLAHLDLYKAKSREAEAKFGKSDMAGNLWKYGLGTNQLYEDYKDKYPNTNVGYSSFRKVFKEVHHAIVVSGSSPNSGDLRCPGNDSSLAASSAFRDQLTALSPGFEEAGEEEDAGGDFEDDESEDLPVYPTKYRYYYYPSDKQNYHDQRPPNDPNDVGSPGVSTDATGGPGKFDNLPVQNPSLTSAHINHMEQRHWGQDGQDLNETVDRTMPSYQANFCQHRQVFEQDSQHLTIAGSGTLMRENGGRSVGNVGGYAHDQSQPEYTDLDNPGHLGKQVYQTAASQYHTLVSQRLAEPNLYPDHHGLQPGHSASGARLDSGLNIQQGLLKDDVHVFGYSGLSRPSQQPHTTAPNSSTSLHTNLHTDANQHSSHTGFSQGSSNTERTEYIVSSLPYPHEQIDKPNQTDRESTIVDPITPQMPVKSAKKKRQKEGTNDSEKKRKRCKSVRNFAEAYPMLAPCHCSRLKCLEKFPEESRQKIHGMFWALGSYNARKQWLLLHIKRIDCKRRRVDRPESSRKSETRYYFLPQLITGALVEVCKTFFLRTLGYKWDSIIDTLRRTTPKGEIISKPDQRGKKSPSHKLSGEITRCVIHYIKGMLQAAEVERLDGSTSQMHGDSACQRSDTKHLKDQQMPYGLTMRDLHNDYRAKHSDHKISYESFRKIYKTPDLDALEKSVTDELGFAGTADSMFTSTV